MVRVFIQGPLQWGDAAVRAAKPLSFPAKLAIAAALAVLLVPAIALVLIAMAVAVVVFALFLAVMLARAMLRSVFSLFSGTRDDGRRNVRVIQR